jgi:hypothetical protein
MSSIIMVILIYHLHKPVDLIKYELNLNGESSYFILHYSHIINITHYLHSDSKDFTLSQQNQPNRNYSFQLITGESLLVDKSSGISWTTSRDQSGWLSFWSLKHSELSVTYGWGYLGVELSSMCLFDIIQDTERTAYALSIAQHYTAASCYTSLSPHLTCHTNCKTLQKVNKTTFKEEVTF